MMRSVHLLAAATAAAFATQVGATRVLAQSPKVVMEEMMVPSEAGIETFASVGRRSDWLTDSALVPEALCLASPVFAC